MKKHAMMSASGAERWMNCPPSARLESKFEETTSEYAEEGTLAHELADLELGLATKQITKRTYNAEIKKIKAHEMFSDEMPKEVAKYVNIVLELYGKHSEILLEQRLDFSHIVKGGFGTGDVSIITDGTLTVIDLKYGKGIPVSAVDNSQLKLYGIGALRRFDLSYDIHTVRLIIVQPRLDNYTEFEISVEDLTKWGEETVKPLADLAHEGKGEFKVGSWCQFCKAKNFCRAYADKITDQSKHSLKDPFLLSEDEMLETYEIAQVLNDWVTSVHKYMSSEALKGKKWKGLKLVEGQSRRKWTDEEKVQDKLTQEGFAESDFMTRKLAGIGAIEKLVGKTNINDLLGKLIEKPAGAPTLVPESNSKPEFHISSAKEDFK